MEKKTPSADVADTARAVEKQAQHVSKSADQLKASAGAIERSASDLTDSADRRTVLATDRTVLAAERTYAAWVRTGLVGLASGIGAHAVLDQKGARWLIVSAASVMIAFSIFCFMAAVWRQLPLARAPKPDTPQLPVVILVLFSILLSLTAAASLVVIVIE
jgi:putative membrane protein